MGRGGGSSYCRRPRRRTSIAIVPPRGSLISPGCKRGPQGPFTSEEAETAAHPLVQSRFTRRGRATRLCSMFPADMRGQRVCRREPPSPAEPHNTGVRVPNKCGPRSEEGRKEGLWPRPLEGGGLERQESRSRAVGEGSAGANKAKGGGRGRDKGQKPPVALQNQTHSR